MEKKNKRNGKGVDFISRVKNQKSCKKLSKILPAVVSVGLPIAISIAGMILCPKPFPTPRWPTIPPKWPGTI